MPKFLYQASYTPDGVKGLLKEGGSGRRKATEEALKSLGAKVESFYFAFGEPDAFLVVDAPDNVTAAALSLAVGAAGLVACKTTVLLTVEEMDAATKKSVTYRPPGK